MEEVYHLHQHTYFAVFYIEKTKININIQSSATRSVTYNRRPLLKEGCITYDRHKANILSWGNKGFESDNQDDVRIDGFRDKLYQLFKKDKEKWTENDLFLLKAVSDFMRLLLEEAIVKSDHLEMPMKESKELGWLHYLFVVPSEWEEEIREILLRPMFVKAGLISKDDHTDRLLFCSDLESICYSLTDAHVIPDFLKRRDNTILCRLSPIKENEMSIKLDLVSTVNHIFDFSDALLYPKVVRSNSILLTTDDIINSIRAFIETEMPINMHEKIIQTIMDIPYGKLSLDTDEYYEDGQGNDGDEDHSDDEEDEEHETNYLMMPLITDTSKWRLDKHQKAFIKTICPFNICANMVKDMVNNVSDIISGDNIKKYSIMTFIDEYSSEIEPDENLSNWSKYILEYNRISRNTRNVEYKSYFLQERLGYESILMGACYYAFQAIQNSDINSKPRIISTVDATITPSIFIKSKPDAIMSIDISLTSTLLSFSLLDENGLVKETWNHDYFAANTRLCSLGSFFSFSEVTTLNVKHSFIKFSKDYLMGDTKLFSSYKNNKAYRDLTTKIESVLSKDSGTEDLFVSTQQHIHIQAFLLFYMIYIHIIISDKLSTVIKHNVDLNIGYTINIEKMLLDRVFHTKECLQDIIYASGLIQKDDLSKKLRITTLGERFFPLVQQSLSLPFPIKSFFVVAQLHKDYIQLTLNQVVTELSSAKENQESVIIRDKIIQIPDIYDSLCLDMWNNIVKDSSLIQLCDAHKVNYDSLSLFSIKNQSTFTSNLKQYISKSTVKNPIIRLSISCNCKVCLTDNDITEISFRPVLQDIASIVSASLINKEFFGKFWNIKYLFHMIHFDCNKQFHNAVINILKETTEDVMIEQSIDIPHYIISKLVNQLLQPVQQQQPFSYKEFRVGVLSHVYSDHYGFGFTYEPKEAQLVYKSKMSDTKKILVSEQTVFPLLKKGDKINNGQTNKTFYLDPQPEPDGCSIYINFFKLKTLDGLKPNGTVYLENILEEIKGPVIYGYSYNSRAYQCIPFEIYITYDADSSSHFLISKIVGEETKTRDLTLLAGSMALRRF